MSSVNVITALPRPRWLSVIDHVRRPHTAMLLWGLVIGLVGALTLLAVTPDVWPLLPAKIADLRNALAVLERGGPLLLGRHGGTGSYYEVGFSDDEGIYVYIPLLCRLFRVADPAAMMRYFYVTLYGIAVAVYPVVFYRLTRSLLAGFAAPVVLLVCVLSMGFSDIYWIPAWGALALLPLIFLLARDRPRFGLVALMGIVLVADWLSSIRSDSGLGIAIAAAIVLLLRRWRWWRMLPALALLAVAYISIPTFVFSAIREQRDHEIGDNAFGHNQPTSHPLWHTAYIGLGYLPNDYGITYKDQVAIARVQREATGTPFLSSRYATVIRRAYFDVVRNHPLEVARQYAAKAAVTIADTAPYLLVVLLTAPAMLLLGPERRIRRRWVLLTLPAIVVGFLPTMIAIPLQGYEEGLYGVIGVVGILGLCWVLGQIEVGSRERGGLRHALAALRASWPDLNGRHGPLRRGVRVTCIACAALISLVVGGHFIRRSAERWQGSSSGVLIDYVQSVARPYET